MEILTKRFLLRDFIQEDEPAFLAYHADPRYAEFCSPEEVAPDFTHQLFQRFMQWATEVPRCNYQLAIDDRRNLQLIGCGGLRQNGYAAEQAANSTAPLEFAYHIFKKLDLYELPILEAWYGLFKTRDTSYYFTIEQLTT